METSTIEPPVVETSAVVWGGTRLVYTIRRSPSRKKTVAMTVDPAGGVLLVAPEHLATGALDGIVTRKAGWIVRRLRREQSRGPPLSPREFVSGESVLYLGRHYRLKVHPHATGDLHEQPLELLQSFLNFGSYNLCSL